MPVQFVNSDSNTLSITDLLQGEGPFKLAVAFLGEHSQQLLRNANRHIQILCNLESGATNPFAIETLLKRPDTEIRTNAKLHAKVYWSPTKAIVTSANFSANGLSYEDEELRGWHEAGVVLSDAAVLRDIEQWYHTLWEKSEEIDSALLATAKEAWSRRRNIPRTHSSVNRSLFDALRKSPQSFKDRRIFFAIWTHDACAPDKNAAQQAADAGFLGLNSKNYDLYVDWDDLPDDAQLINFKLEGKRVSYIEMTKSFPRSDRPYIRGHYKGSRITITKKISRIDDIFTLTTDDKKLLRTVGEMLWDKAGGDEYGRYVSLYEARDILR